MSKTKDSFNYFHHQITCNAMKGSRFFVRIILRKCADTYTVALYFRIKCDYSSQQILYSTGLKCLKSDFNPKKQTVKQKGIDQILQAEKQRIYKAIYYLNEQSKGFDLSQLKSVLIKSKNGVLVADVCEVVLREMQKEVKQLSFEQSKSVLTKFLRISKLDKMVISEVTHLTLDKLLFKYKENYQIRSFKKIVGLVKRVFQKAYNTEIIKDNPFSRLDLKQLFKTNIPIKKKVFDVDRLKSDVLMADSSFNADAAKFQILTGMAFTDTKSLKDTMFVKDGDNLFLVKNRDKTDIEVLIPIDARAVDLFKKHNGFSKLNYYSYLKQLKKNHGITTHYLRHAKARELLSKGMNLEAVARILGHNDIKTTLIYAPISGRKLSEAEIKLALE